MSRADRNDYIRALAEPSTFLAPSAFVVVDGVHHIVSPVDLEIQREELQRRLLELRRWRLFGPPRAPRLWETAFAAHSSPPTWEHVRAQARICNAIRARLRALGEA